MIQKKIIFGIALMLCIALMVMPGAAFSGSGSGTELDPYIIMNAGQLQEMNNALGAWYKLGADIDLEGVTWTPIGTSSNPFTGTLDGNGHSIISQPNVLFHTVSHGSIINLKISDVNSNSIVSLFATYLINNGVIDSCCIESCILSNTAIYIAPFIYKISGNSIVSNSYILNSDFQSNDVTIGGKMPDSGTVSTISKIYVSANINGKFGVCGLATNTGSGSWDNTKAKTEKSVFLGTITTDNVDNSGRVVAYIGMTNLVDNYALSSSTINNVVPTSYVSTTQKNGENIQTLSESFFKNTLGWDFTNTWYWDTENNLPKLQVFRNNVAQINSITERDYTHAQNANELTADVTPLTEDPITYTWAYSTDGTTWNTIGTGLSVNWIPPATPGTYQIKFTASSGDVSTSASTTTIVYVTPAEIQSYPGNISTSTADPYALQSAWSLPGNMTSSIFIDSTVFNFASYQGLYSLNNQLQSIALFSEYGFGTITDSYQNTKSAAVVTDTGYAFAFNSSGSPTRLKDSGMNTPQLISIGNTAAAVYDGSKVFIYSTAGTLTRSISTTVSDIATNELTDVTVGHNLGTTLYIWYGSTGSTTQTFSQAIKEVKEITGTNSFIVGTAANTYIVSISAAGIKSIVVTSAETTPLTNLAATQTYTLIGGNSAEMYIIDPTGSNVGTYSEGSSIRTNAIARVSGLTAASGGLDENLYIFDKSGSSSWTMTQKTDMNSALERIALSTDSTFLTAETSTQKLYCFKRQEGESTSSYYLNGVILTNSGDVYIGQFSWNGNQIYTDSEGVFTVPVVPGTTYNLICGGTQQQYTATNIASQSHVFRLNPELYQSAISYTVSYNDALQAIEMNYQDTKDLTTAVVWKVTDKNMNLVYNQTLTAGQTGTYTVPLANQSDTYLVTVSASRGQMTVQNSWQINPQGESPINLFGLDETGRNIIFCFVLMILGGLFGVMHSSKGAIAVSLVALWMRWMELITVPWICIIIAAVLAVLAAIGHGGQDKV